MRGAIRLGIFRIGARVKVLGAENIPDTLPGIVMINHISLIDPVLGMGAVTNRFVIPMSKIENRSSPVIAPLVWWWGSYYVDRDSLDRQALENSIELIKSGQLILLSPEGTRHKGGLTRPKEGVAYVAAKSGAIVIPCAIVGAENWNRDIFGFKRPRMSVTFGRPFRFKVDSTARLNRDQRSAMMEEAMYQLALTIPDESLRGDYRDVSKATTETIEFIEPR